MTKIKTNAAEIIITILAIITLLTSCGGNHYVCPSYASVEVVGTGADWTEGMDELNK